MNPKEALRNLPSKRWHTRYLRGLLEDIVIVLLLINGDHTTYALREIDSCTLDLLRNLFYCLHLALIVLIRTPGSSALAFGHRKVIVAHFVQKVNSRG